MNRSFATAIVALALSTTVFCAPGGIQTDQPRETIVMPAGFEIASSPMTSLYPWRF